MFELSEFVNAGGHQCAKVSTKSHFKRFLLEKPYLFIFRLTGLYFAASLWVTIGSHYRVLSVNQGIVLILLIQVAYILTMAGGLLSRPDGDLKRKERWGIVAGLLMNEMKIPKNEWSKLDADIERVVRLYSRRAVLWKWLFSTVLISVVCNCLATPEFARSLFYLTSWSQLWQVNPVGAVGVILIPVMYLPIFIFFDLPLAWLIQTQEELENAI
ncbi:hypothetical protein OAG63_00640 [Methylacidiphilales bacterium]|nr:hypothetical protein [Candidatus Methylacidiphilales bacterium]